MPRQSKGPRLYAQPAEYKADGSLRKESVWVIRDKNIKRSTGISVTDSYQPPREAHEALAEYILSTRSISKERNRNANQIAIADVISLYLQDKTLSQSRPNEVASRAQRLLIFWGDKTLSHITGSMCRQYVDYRQNAGAARRELEDLRAAIKYFRQEGLCRDVVEVTLPQRDNRATDG